MGNIEIAKQDGAKLRTADIKSVRLGRYPFAAGIKYHIARRAPYLSTSTIEENERKLRMMARIFEELKANGQIKNTDPRRISATDIEGFLLYMKEKKLATETREKYLAVLGTYLITWGNSTMDDMKRQHRLIPPKMDKPIKALSAEELAAVLQYIDGREEHWAKVMGGIIALSFATGIRPKEAVGAEIEDLRLPSTFYVRHPKGEETWAVPQWVPIIRGDMIPRIEAYMRYRSGAGGKYLFENPRTGKPYALNSVRMWCRTITRDTGIYVTPKIFRPTLASITIKGNLSRMKAVSLQLRHKKMSTTEQFYALIEDGSIEDEIGEAWKENPL